MSLKDYQRTQKGGTAASGKMTEKAWQAEVVKLAQMLGWTVVHWRYHLGMEDGFPDLECFHPQHGVIWLELKTYRGTVSAAQVAWIDRIRASGNRAWVLYPDDTDALLAILQGNDVTIEEPWR
jgi:hypothetical protein